MQSINSIKIQGKQVILQSPSFAFVVDISAGLRAVSWKNLLTGRTLNLGNGPEAEFDIGLPEQPVKTPMLLVVKAPAALASAGGIEAVFELEADEPKARVTVSYRWDGKNPVLRKFVTITNRGGAEWNRLLNVRLGVYPTDAELSGGKFVTWPPSFATLMHNSGGLQGFPVYADGEFFLGLAHPAGWADQKPGEINLHHYPGTRLLPGASRTCMETVYGVGAAGKGREAFVAHIRGRMRRVLRGHDKPYAIFDPFGARMDGNPPGIMGAVDDGNINENEAFLLDMIGKVADGQRDAAGRFDLFSIDFWHDKKGDIRQADPARFPNQFERIKKALDDEGIRIGLWISSARCWWTIGDNPATFPAIAQEVGPDFGDLHISKKSPFWFCRATEPVRSMYREGFIHHIRENGVRMIKCDDFMSQCSNPKHEHLPGPYGNEATHDGAIECYQALDKECPDFFIMLYWGHHSPWWLLFGDTMFETGVQGESANPGNMSAPFIRDGVTRSLDRMHVFAKDVPWLGTDPMGVWLSHWGDWNGGVGVKRWQEGLVMDICRGNALAQIWSDPQWLTPPERKQMGEFIALMKAQPKCFINSRLILGDPWKREPYGYCCTDGKRAFLAINNGTWEDRTVKLQLNAGWGLPDKKNWDLYRWYPNPAKLTGAGQAFKDEVSMAMRPFEVVLLEVVPHGETPTLSRNVAKQQLPTIFSEHSRPVKITVTEEKPAAGTSQKKAAFSGNFALPDKCHVFAPFAKEDGVPEEGLLRRVPAALELGGKRAVGKPASFDADRIIDLASFIGGTGPAVVEKTAFVYIPFTVREAGPATFGFGADWWYEAYLDGKLISTTMENGNVKWPLEMDNHTVTVELKPGEHVLVIRFLRGSNSAQLAVGGPLDLENAAVVTARVISGEIPANKNGGLLVVVVELSLDDSPHELLNFGSFFTASGVVAGKPIVIQPALGPLGAFSSWQSWRYETAIGSAPQPFEVRVMDSFKTKKQQRRFSAYFLPGQKG